VVIAVILMFVAVADDQSPVSCGAACTYLFVREFNLQARLADTVVLLPDKNDGHSFGELAAAADALGVSASIVNVKEFGRLPKEPFIAHVQSADGDPIGHFVFLRPLEPTFAQYQMIAAPLEPEVIFANELLARTDFTGWVMTRSTPKAAFWIGVAVIVVGAGFFVAPPFFNRRMSLFDMRLFGH
jgi:ABC-type bacteriocin/lantibiotic exporter with double-glycine peptidase domain